MPPLDDESRRLQPIVIEAITPQIDCGRDAVKRVVGDVFRVGATVFIRRGGRNWVHLDPAIEPAHVLVVERKGPQEPGQ